MQTMITSAYTLLLSMIVMCTGNKQTESTRKIGPGFKGATSWLNSSPLKLADLRGKVVLIDFWTYTCINWRRTLPYVREWERKYRDQGLIVIGVHTPEFTFEYNIDNVRTALKEMNISYPVAIDNQYEIWKSFNNNYWPALYLIDAKGKIKYQKFGEGDYEESERQIQKLLQEATGKNIPSTIATPALDGIEAAADWKNLQSAENFLGYTRTTGFASPGEIVVKQNKTFAFPKALKLNQWALSGDWTIREEFVSSTSPLAKIIYKFHARDLHVVMGPAVPGKSIKFRVLIDGNPPGVSHGGDVDSEGNGTITGQRTYQLIRQQGVIADHEFQIEFTDAGAEVFDFTFG